MFLKYKSKQFKILCASAYTPYDLNLCGMKGNTYQWGYFPEVDELDIAGIISEKNQKQVQILWVGRMVGLKHPEKAILIAEKLKKDKIDFHLRMIGDGPLLSKMKAMIERKGLTDHVELLRNKSQQEVRSFMKEANIYLFTSDRKEGWGSVLTESMNYGCGVIASHAAGSTPFIAEHKKNALIYDNDSIDSLYENVKLLSCDLEFCRKIGLAAYDSLINNFSPRVVANRFYKLCTNLLDGNEDVFVDKVCSKAQSISENEMYIKLIGR
jgi:glycosyltransferase involved in cell wall biosynthesis